MEPFVFVKKVEWMTRSHPDSAANVMSIRPRLSRQRSPPRGGGGVVSSLNVCFRPSHWRHCYRRGPSRGARQKVEAVTWEEDEVEAGDNAECPLEGSGGPDPASRFIVSGSVPGTHFSAINLTKTNNGVPHHPSCLKCPTCLFQISGHAFSFLSLLNELRSCRARF